MYRVPTIISLLFVNNTPCNCLRSLTTNPYNLPASTWNTKSTGSEGISSAATTQSDRQQSGIASTDHRVTSSLMTSSYPSTSLSSYTQNDPWTMTSLSGNSWFEMQNWRSQVRIIQNIVLLYQV